jgi:hypothetical protein
MIVSPATVNIDIVAPSDGAGTEKTDTSSKVRANNSGVDGTGLVPVDRGTAAAVAAVAAGTVEEVLHVDVLVAGAVAEVVVSDPTDDGEPTVLFDVVADRPASDPHAASDETATSSATAVRRFTQPSDQWHQPEHCPSPPHESTVTRRCREGLHTRLRRRQRRETSTATNVVPRPEPLLELRSDEPFAELRGLSYSALNGSHWEP